MTWTLVTSQEKFPAAAEEWLLRDPVRNTVPLTVLRGIRTGLFIDDVMLGFHTPDVSPEGTPPDPTWDRPDPTWSPPGHRASPAHHRGDVPADYTGDSPADYRGDYAAGRSGNSSDHTGNFSARSRDFSDRTIDGVALHTQPFPLLLGAVEPSLLAPLAAELIALEHPLPGVTGPVALAEAFANAWWRPETDRRSERLYRLGALSDVNVPGSS